MTTEGTVKLIFNISVMGDQDGKITAEALDAMLDEEAERIKAHCADLPPRFNGGAVKIESSFASMEVR